MSRSRQPQALGRCPWTSTAAVAADITDNLPSALNTATIVMHAPAVRYRCSSPGPIFLSSASCAHRLHSLKVMLWGLVGGSQSVSPGTLFLWFLCQNMNRFDAAGAGAKTVHGSRTFCTRRAIPTIADH